MSSIHAAFDFMGDNWTQGGGSERAFYFSRGHCYNSVLWTKPFLSDTVIASGTRKLQSSVKDCFPLLISYKAKQTTLLLSVHLGLLKSLLIFFFPIGLSKTSQQIFVLNESARLEKMSYACMQTKCCKRGFK